MPQIPEKLPPVFLAWAQDDAMTLSLQVRFRGAPESAGYKPEVHVYDRGGHGFGMKKQGTSSAGRAPYSNRSATMGSTRDAR